MEKDGNKRGKRKKRKCMITTRGRNVRKEREQGRGGLHKEKTRIRKRRKAKKNRSTHKERKIIKK